MKKSMIIAALMCCIVSMSAQQPQNEPEALKSMKAKIQQVERLNRHENNFTVKLDSVTGDGIRFLYEYDDRLNCTKEMRYYDDWLEDVFENTYDEFNRLISMTHIDNYYNSTIKEEYTYNAQGLIMEEIASYPLNGSWKPFDKWTYEYDEDENMTLAVRYVLYAGDEWSEYRKLTCEYENGLMQTAVFYHFEDEWQPESKNDFSYNTQGLCIEEIISEYIYEDWAFSEKNGYFYNEQGLRSERIFYDYYANGEWHSHTRSVYEYDAENNLVSLVYYGHPSNSQAWTNTEKYEYTYDANNNCTSYLRYYYNSGNWHFDYGYGMTYDPTVDIEQIAGLDRFWDALWEEMMVYAPVYSKLQQLTLLENGEPDYLMDFHYSGFNSIDDSTENHLAVWPNPATETVYIEGSEVAEMQVYNALGQMVKTVRGTNEIDLSGLVNGVYLLRVTDADGKNHVARVAVKE